MRVLSVVENARDQALDEPVHDARTAAVLGIALGISFATCFATGLVSHFIQQPPAWFAWGPRPAGLYRVTQGIHVATGLAAVPLLLAKLWSVFPHLWSWPPFTSVAHAVERAMLVPLVFGSTFMLFSGTANIAQWYPWHFPFPVAHYWIAWITIGALVTHIAAKLTVARQAISVRINEPPPGSTAMSRRQYLGLTAAAAGAVTLTTAGQTLPLLRRVTFFAPRRPDLGPQGLPVNRVSTPQIHAAASDSSYRLEIKGDVPKPVSLTLDELRAMPRRAAELPIACVEGWSASAHWRGVPVRDLLALAGVHDVSDIEVVVHSLERDGAYNHSMINASQANDPDTLVALELNGEPLHPDHGWPCRLIGPNRPGVQQTKWLRDLTVHKT